MSEFKLDKRLRADSLYLEKLPLCDLLLMNDSRWPWLILVPRITGAREIHLLDSKSQKILSQETALVASILAEVSDCEKINTGALGNIVRQLHVHIIARNREDANWPGPVWGFGDRQPYDPEVQENLVSSIRKRLA